MATLTFCSTVRSLKRRMFWKVRQMPPVTVARIPLPLMGSPSQQHLTVGGGI